MACIEINFESEEQLVDIAARVQVLLDHIAMGGIDSDATRDEVVIWIATGNTLRQQREGAK